jgi:hypothetical protein
MDVVGEHVKNIAHLHNWPISVRTKDLLQSQAPLSVDFNHRSAKSNDIA